MRAQLQEDMNELKMECPYAQNCPVLISLKSRSLEDVNEFYELTCTTQKRYDCTQFQMMEAKN